MKKKKKKKKDKTKTERSADWRQADLKNDGKHTLESKLLIIRIMVILGTKSNQLKSNY